MICSTQEAWRIGICVLQFFEEEIMAEGKMIAVFGATGAHGGGLVRAILRDSHGGFAARAITPSFNEYFCGARDAAFSKSLNPELQDFKIWLMNNDRAILKTQSAGA
jgi:hypothetical protein